MGYKIKEEFINQEGKIIDIIAEKNNQKIAIEIETGKSNIVLNILKNISDFDNIIIVPTNYSAEAKIRNILSKLKIENTKIEIIKGVNF